MGKYFTDNQELYSAQYDILFENLENNPYFEENPIESLNKKLKTNAKEIISAINEVFDKNESINIKTNNMIKLYNNIIGDSLANTNLISDLKKIDYNMLLAITKIYKQLNGEDLENPIDISGIANNVKEAILSLDERITKLENKLINGFILKENTCEHIVNGVINYNTYIIDEDNIKWSEDRDYIRVVNDNYTVFRFNRKLPFDMKFIILEGDN